jgi:hypothetical protein
VEFNVAGECLSLQAKVEQMQDAIADWRRRVTIMYNQDIINEMEKFLPEEE